MNIVPKKSLGQNFLQNKNIINKIVELGQISSDSYVIEIGPGTGNLTEEIIKKKPKKFLAIEKDVNLYRKLKSKYKSNLDLLNQDVLKIDWNNFSNNHSIVFGNLPYNISSRLLTSWLKQIHYSQSIFIENIIDTLITFLFLSENFVSISSIIMKGNHCLIDERIASSTLFSISSPSCSNTTLNKSEPKSGLPNLSPFFVSKRFLIFDLVCSKDVLVL